MRYDRRKDFYGPGYSERVSQAEQEAAELIRIAETSPKQFLRAAEQLTSCHTKEICRAIGLRRFKGDLSKILVRRIDRIVKYKNRPGGRTLYEKIMGGAIH